MNNTNDAPQIPDKDQQNLLDAASFLMELGDMGISDNDNLPKKKRKRQSNSKKNKNTNSIPGNILLENIQVESSSLDAELPGNRIIKRAKNNSNLLIEDMEKLMDQESTDQNTDLIPAENDAILPPENQNASEIINPQLLENNSSQAVTQNKLPLDSRNFNYRGGKPVGENKTIHEKAMKGKMEKIKYYIRNNDGSVTQVFRNELSKVYVDAYDNMISIAEKDVVHKGRQHFKPDGVEIFKRHTKTQRKYRKNTYKFEDGKPVKLKNGEKIVSKGKQYFLERADKSRIKINNVDRFENNTLVFIADGKRVDRSKAIIRMEYEPKKRYFVKLNKDGVEEEACPYTTYKQYHTFKFDNGDIVDKAIYEIIPEDQNFINAHTGRPQLKYYAKKKNDPDAEKILVSTVYEFNQRKKKNANVSSGVLSNPEPISTTAVNPEPISTTEESGTVKKRQRKCNTSNTKKSNTKKSNKRKSTHSIENSNPRRKRKSHTSNTNAQSNSTDDVDHLQSINPIVNPTINLISNDDPQSITTVTTDTSNLIPVSNVNPLQNTISVPIQQGSRNTGSNNTPPASIQTFLIPDILNRESNNSRSASIQNNSIFQTYNLHRYNFHNRRLANIPPAPPQDISISNTLNRESNNIPPIQPAPPAVPSHSNPLFQNSIFRQLSYGIPLPPRDNENLNSNLNNNN